MWSLDIPGKAEARMNPKELSFPQPAADEASKNNMTCTPSSCYRLQLHSGFTFDDAAAVADYLKELGISHVYCSPYLQAAPGSMHGYDVVDQQSVNEELGGEEGHARFCARLGELGLGQVLDIVPNHMATGRKTLLVGCAGERAVEPVRDVVRHRLEFGRGEAAEQGADSGAGRPVRAGAERGQISIEAARAIVSGALHGPCVSGGAAVAGDSLSTAAEDDRCADTLGFIADSLARLPAPESTDHDAGALRDIATRP